MSERNVQRLLVRGEIPGRKIGGQWRTPAAELYRFTHGTWPAQASAGDVTSGADHITS